MPETRHPRNPEVGAIGRTLIDTLNELLAARAVSQRRLSAELDKVGRPIVPLGISRLLKGERRVDVDELVALAVVLGVNPSALLFPRHVRADDVVELTPTTKQRAAVVWAWADGRVPLPPDLLAEGTTEIPTPDYKFADFQQHARPDTAANAPEPDQAVAEVMTLERMLGVVLAAREQPEVWAQWRDMILRRFRLVGIQLEELFARLDREAVRAGFEFDTAGAMEQLRVSVAAVRQPAAPSASSTDKPAPGPHGAATSRVQDPFGERDQ